MLEPVLGVDDDHLAWAELAAPDLLAGGEVEDADFRRAADEVAADHPAQRAETVAVERGTDGAAVGEDEPGGSVPRLDEAGVEAVEVADLPDHLGIVRPGRRHEHRQRVPDVAAAAHEQLERVVEHPAAQLLVPAECGGARPHPVDVAADRVDLAVVAEQAKRLRALPRGLGVRREALVEDPERDL